MFEGIGVEWGMTFLGCIATLFIPMPFILYRYGKKIRAKSKFAPAPDIEQDKRRDEESRGAASEGEESRTNGTSKASDVKDVDEKKSH
jgi:DHA1 family multidrug resistance protein-like MFS transporter